MTMRPMAVAGLLLVVVAAAGCLVGERPVAPDADGDGLPDISETAGWNVTVVTDTLECPPPDDDPRGNQTYHVTANVYIDDNDTDGLNDQLEFAFRTDPNKADTDGDGLTDKEEWDLRQDRDRYFRVTVLWGGDVDSDADCLTDHEEVAEGFFVEALGRTVHSDPTDADGDRDGWTDWQEITQHGTDPLDSDTDDDGARDNLDLDPFRNVSIFFRIVEVRVDADVERAYFIGILADLTLEAEPFDVTRGEWTSVPPEAAPVVFDVADLTASPTVKAMFSWWSEGGGPFDLSPADTQTVEIRIRPTADAWAVRAGDSFGEDGNECLVEGPDGAFRVDIRIGAAGEDPASWPALCA